MRIILKEDVSRNPFFDTMMNFQIDENLSEKNSEISEEEINPNAIELKPYDSGNEDLFQSVLDFKLDAVPEDLKLIYI
ncbi:MAG: hypothetical protein R3A12_14350 [Ignavibacteria bacterium]